LNFQFLLARSRSEGNEQYSHDDNGEDIKILSLANVASLSHFRKCDGLGIKLSSTQLSSSDLFTLKFLFISSSSFSLRDSCKLRAEHKNLINKTFSTESHPNPIYFFVGRPLNLCPGYFILSACVRKLIPIDFVLVHELLTFSTHTFN
jgi:hypothetical protein